MSQIHLAVAQNSPVSNRLEENCDLAIDLLIQASRQGANLALFPELFLCGYDLEQIKLDPKAASLTTESSLIAEIASVCKEKKIATVLGLCLQRVGGITNSAVIIDEGGVIVDVFDKAHLWHTEKPIFLPGKRLVAFSYLGFKIGIGICYDAGFPEFSRTLALNGVDLLLYPSAFAVGEERHRYFLYYPQRALENTVYLAVANLTGSANGLQFFGESLIVDPTGRIIAKGDSEPGVFTSEIQHEKIVEARKNLPYLLDRRPELYSLDIKDIHKSNHEEVLK